MALISSISPTLKLGERILTKQLNEQILEDGGHFERSPMYHQTILHRILDTYQLINNNQSLFSNRLFELVHSKSRLMLAWLQQMTFSDGSIPHFNDSTDDIAPKTELLKKYANELGIEVDSKKLGASGFRFYRKDHFELAIDV